MRRPACCKNKCFMNNYNGVVSEHSETKLSQLNQLRGLFALEIIIGHVGRNTNGILLPFGRFMICSVAFFFFVSAYGMVLSCRKREGYLGCGFLVQKPLFLLLISLLIYALEGIVDFLVSPDLGFCDGFWSLSAYFHRTNWFVWELIGLYLIFWLCYRFGKRYRVILVTCCIVVGILAFYFAGAGVNWYASVSGFLLGVLFGEKDTVINKICTVPGLSVTFVLALFGMCVLFVKEENFLSLVLIRNAMCISVLLFTVLISGYAILRENPVTRFLTRYADALYFSQFIWLAYGSAVFPDRLWVRLAFVLLATTLSAVLVVQPMIHALKSGLRKCLR